MQEAERRFYHPLRPKPRLLTRGGAFSCVGWGGVAPPPRRFRRYVDRFVEFGGYPGIDEVAVDPGRSAHFVAEQRAYGYDLVVQMQGSGRTSNPCALALGGRMTAGYYEGEPPAGLTFGAPYPDDQPEVLRNMGLARLLGCPNRGLELEFPLFTPDRAEAAALLTPHPPAPSPSRGEGEQLAAPLPC